MTAIYLFSAENNVTLKSNVYPEFDMMLLANGDGTSTLCKNGQNYTRLELDEDRTNMLIRDTLFEWGR